MKAIEIQKKMNSALAAKSPDYRKAHRLYKSMNTARKKEGLPFLSLPNLEKRFKELAKKKS